MGIEPTTGGTTIRCSTNWATATAGAEGLEPSTFGVRVRRSADWAMRLQASDGVDSNHRLPPYQRGALTYWTTVGNRNKYMISVIFIRKICCFADVFQNELHFSFQKIQTHSFWRRMQDSNLRALSDVLFSRQAPSTSRPIRHIYASGRSRTFSSFLMTSVFETDALPLCHESLCKKIARLADHAKRTVLL